MSNRLFLPRPELEFLFEEKVLFNPGQEGTGSLMVTYGSFVSRGIFEGPKFIVMAGALGIEGGVEMEFYQAN